MRDNASHKHLNQFFATISDVGNQFGVSHRTLRFYEARGLVAPRRVGRKRVYGNGDIDRIALILKLKSFGLSLANIEAVIANSSGGAPGLSDAQCTQQLAILENKLKELRSAISELKTLCVPELLRSPGPAEAGVLAIGNNTTARQTEPAS